MKEEVEAVFRRHMEAAPYAKDLIKRIAFEVVPLLPNSPQWQPMDTAPTDGKHVILALKCDCFVYSIQGAFMNGKWMNAADRDGEPLAWIPNVLLPNEFCPWTDEYKAANA